MFITKQQMPMIIYPIKCTSYTHKDNIPYNLAKRIIAFFQVSRYNEITIKRTETLVKRMLLSR